MPKGRGFTARSVKQSKKVLSGTAFGSGEDFYFKCFLVQILETPLLTAAS